MKRAETVISPDLRGGGRGAGRIEVVYCRISSDDDVVVVVDDDDDDDDDVPRDMTGPYQTHISGISPHTFVHLVITIAVVVAPILLLLLLLLIATNPLHPHLHMIPRLLTYPLNDLDE